MGLTPQLLAEIWTRGAEKATRGLGDSTKLSPAARGWRGNEPWALAK